MNFGNGTAKMEEELIFEWYSWLLTGKILYKPSWTIPISNILTALTTTSTKMHWRTASTGKSFIQLLKRIWSWLSHLPISSISQYPKVFLLEDSFTNLHPWERKWCKNTPYKQLVLSCSFSVFHCLEKIQEQGNLSTCLDMSIWIVRAKTRLVCFNRNLETKILESSKVLEKHWSWENISIKKESRNWSSLQPSKCIWDPQPNLSGFQQNSAELGPRRDFAPVFFDFSSTPFTAFSQPPGGIMPGLISGNWCWELKILGPKKHITNVTSHSITSISRSK